MNLGDLEVVWPLHRWHYLSVPEAGMVNMAAVDEPRLPPIVETPGRQLVARALLAAPDASQQRVGELLGVSRRTIGRMADADLTTALRDSQGLERARTCLAETASRGSTVEERAAAVAWLQAAARDEHQLEVKRAVAKPQGSTAASRTPRVLARRPHRSPRSTPSGASSSAFCIAARSSTTSWRPRDGAARR
jgi:hypothetical protein